MSAPTIEAPCGTTMPATMHAMLHAMPTADRFRHAMWRATTRQHELEENRDKLRAAATLTTDDQKRAKFLRAASIMQRRANHHAMRANHLSNCHDAVSQYQGLGGISLLGRTIASRRHSD